MQLSRTNVPCVIEFVLFYTGPEIACVPTLGVQHQITRDGILRDVWSLIFWMKNVLEKKIKYVLKFLKNIICWLSVHGFEWSHTLHNSRHKLWDLWNHQFLYRINYKIICTSKLFVTYLLYSIYIYINNICNIFYI